MIRFQTGAAPVTPEASFGFIGWLSLFPTQTPATTPLVYPSVQLARLSSVVPVLTDTVLPAILSHELGPNTSFRASLSDKMCEIRYDTVGSMICSPRVF